MNKFVTSLRTKSVRFPLYCVTRTEPAVHILCIIFILQNQKKSETATRRRDGVVTLLAEFFISLPARWLVSGLCSFVFKARVIPAENCLSGMTGARDFPRFPALVCRIRLAGRMRKRDWVCWKCLDYIVLFITVLSHVLT